MIFASGQWVPSLGQLMTTTFVSGQEWAYIPPPSKSPPGMEGSWGSNGGCIMSDEVLKGIETGRIKVTSTWPPTPVGVKSLGETMEGYCKIALKTVAEHNEIRLRIRKESAQSARMTGVACPNCGGELMWENPFGPSPITRAMMSGVQRGYNTSLAFCYCSLTVELER